MSAMWRPGFYCKRAVRILIPASSCVHDGLAGTLSEGIVEIGTVVLSEVVTGERLTTVLVDTLKNLNIEATAY